MRKRSRVVLVLTLAFILQPGASPPSLAQSNKPDAAGQLVALLEKSGYSYTKVGDGVWEIPAEGKNLKDFSIRLALAEDIVLVIAKLADRKGLSPKEGLLIKLLELNHHFDSAKLALGQDMLYARMDLHVRLLDAQELKYLVEQMVNVVDEAYPQIKPFLAGTK